MARTGNYALGAAKVAAQRIGCSVDTYLARRAAGEQWCSYCRSWQAVVHNNQCRACRAVAWHTRYKSPRRRSGKCRPVANNAPPHPPQRWCSCEWCAKSRSNAA